MKRFVTLCLPIILLIGLLQVSSLGHTAQGSSLKDKEITNERAIFAPTISIANPFGIPDWTGNGGSLAGSYGASVASAGDVNGDGYADVVVGAPYYENGQIGEGAAFIYYGSASGLQSAPAWTYESNTVNCNLGRSVASAGDVNHDGFDDVLVGSEFCTTSLVPGHREGRAYLFQGSATGLSQTDSWMYVGGGLDEGFGWSVASAGDVNNDSYDDVIIGAPWASYPEGHEGRAYVFYGSALGLSETANWTAEGNIAWRDFGQSVDSAGDVNGDGVDDVIIGWSGFTDGQELEGAAVVYLGSDAGLSNTPDWMFQSNHDFTELGESVSGAGDVNNDGYSDVIVGGYKYSDPTPTLPENSLRQGIAYLFLGSSSGLLSVPDWSYANTQDYAEYGQSVASAGDVNQDGYDDVLVGAPWYSNGEVSEGMAFLYFGSSDGLLSAPVYTSEGNQANANLGYSVASAGDVNNDGFDDIILGAQGFNKGRAFAYYGIKARLLLPIVVR